jgi:hypothetical protein
VGFALVVNNGLWLLALILVGNASLAVWANVSTAYARLACLMHTTLPSLCPACQGTWVCRLWTSRAVGDFCVLIHVSN